MVPSERKNREVNYCNCRGLQNDLVELHGPSLRLESPQTLPISGIITALLVGFQGKKEIWHPKKKINKIKKRNSSSVDVNYTHKKKYKVVNDE